MLKDITSVETTKWKGLKIKGNGIKFKINLLKNGEELKSAIKGALSARSPESNFTAEELKKYKELLDSGVITQSEFDAKKRQLLDR